MVGWLFGRSVGRSTTRSAKRTSNFRHLLPSNIGSTCVSTFTIIDFSYARYEIGSYQWIIGSCCGSRGVSKSHRRRTEVRSIRSIQRNNECPRLGSFWVFVGCPRLIRRVSARYLRVFAGSLQGFWGVWYSNGSYQCGEHLSTWTTGLVSRCEVGSVFVVR